MFVVQALLLFPSIWRIYVSYQLWEIQRTLEFQILGKPAQAHP